MFEDYLCRCGNADECPHKEECERAKRVAGICTMSLFYTGEDKCEYFIPIKESDKDVK